MAAPKADIAQLIETLYVVAAHPERWQEVVAAADAAADAPPETTAILSQLRGLEDEQAPVQPELGVILLSASGDVVGWNEAGEAVFRDRLGVIETRGLKFFNPANHEALADARRRLAGPDAQQVIVKFVQARDDDPHFAYVTPAAAAPAGLVAGLAGFERAAHAIIFPAIEASDDLWRSLRDSFGLTPAETRLAARLKEGLTLKEAAEDLGVSLNTVRNQLRAVFEKMGLGRQSELVRALAQLGALSSSLHPRSPTTVSASEAGALATAPSLKIHRLPDGRGLAYRDYGDPAGQPCLLFHQGIGSSLLPRGSDGLARALGLRIICPERPGVGRSDLPSELSFEGVSADLIHLTQALRITRVRVAAFMYGAPFALAYARAGGPRVERILLASGRPTGASPTSDSERANPVLMLRRRLIRAGWLAEPLYAILKRRLSRKLVAQMVQSAASAPSDSAYLRSHPGVVDFIFDYMGEALSRSSRGVAREMGLLARTERVEAQGLSAPVHVWHGAEDPVIETGEFVAWVAHPCEVVRTIPDVGHFLPHKLWPEVLSWLAAETPAQAMSDRQAASSSTAASVVAQEHMNRTDPSMKR